MNMRDFYHKLATVSSLNVAVSGPTFVFTFTNSKGKEFPLDIETLFAFLRYLRDNQGACIAAWENADTRKDAFTAFEEKSYRNVYALVADVPGLRELAAHGGSQTKSLTQLIAALIAFLSDQEYQNVEANTFFDINSVQKAADRIPASFAQLEAMISQEQQPTPGTGTDSEEIKRAFHAWLVSARQVADSTATKYSGTSISTADNLYRISHPHFPGLFALRSIEEVSAVIAELKQNDDWIKKNTDGNNMYSVGVNHYREFLSQGQGQVRLPLPKPFVLLAGISGTGKTRFVKEQALRAQRGEETYLLQPVRPDWHEPSELLGYVSRLHGVRFVATSLLAFMAKAWRATHCKITPRGYELTAADKTVTYWLCLDEMNLAPVEQYFADFLAVVETRDWRGDTYNCAPILAIHRENLDDNAIVSLRNDLGFKDGDPLWDHFVVNGMPLPPNFVVAGTVNMDETTHGFSRKVIDRAFTIDFGEFFPNEFDKYFSPSVSAVTLTFPRWSHVDKADLAGVKADPDGSRTIAFLEGVNSVLLHSPFSVAFRALNELLVALRSFSPATDAELAAVWDDFLMTKLLPRLEGDAEKMDYSGTGMSLLTRLRAHTDAAFSAIAPTGRRPDLFRRATSGSGVEVELRTGRTLHRMQQRLEKHNFTSFWP